MDFKVPNRFVQKSFKLIIFLENGLHNVLVYVQTESYLYEQRKVKKIQKHYEYILCFVTMIFVLSF
jgi:hypothetical protein